VELVEKSDYKSAENQTYQNDYKNFKYDWLNNYITIFIFNI
jgi:hypothetical protein